MSQERIASDARVRVEKIGGIDRTEIECPPGVTVLTGRNATNRTSFLQAVMAVLGSDDATLKADADEGHVELTIGDDTYSRRLRRRNSSIVTDGDPYLDDATLADLFAFLLESNEARRAVAGGDDLREVIMRPVDTAAIESQIKKLERERDDVDAELDELESLNEQLPALEENRVGLERRIEEKREELAAKEAEIEELDADIDETREDKAELEAKLDELRDVRGDLENVRNRIDSEQESIRALEADREEAATAIAEHSDIPADRIERLDDEISRLRGRVQAVENTIADLQSIVQFNQNTLEEGRPNFMADLPSGEDDGTGDPITDQLTETGDETVCWTCGSSVEASQIETTLERLRDLHQEKNETRRSLRDEIDELQAERKELEEQRRERDELERKRREIDEELDERQDRLDELRARREQLTDDVEHLEGEVQNLQSEDYGEVIELHTEANQLEFELERLEDDLDDVTSDIDEIETRVNERDQLESQREELRSELNDLRTRIDDLERAAVDEFNDHMDRVLELLGYENLDRVWIERVEREVREGRKTVSQSHFELHVVRSTADGTVYEDTVDHLSESEREVTGLVFALAGYLAHEVYETVPFMLLDSVEAVDSDRIASLVEYLQGFPDYLVVALLPEDARALGDDVHRITEL